MGDIQFDRVPAIAPAGEPHVRSSSDAPRRQDTAERRPAKPSRRAEDAEEDANHDFEADNDTALDDTDPPHALDRFA